MGNTTARVCTLGCERLRLIDRCVRCNPGYSDNRQDWWIYSEQKRTGATLEQAERKYLAQICTGCARPGTDHPSGGCPGKAAGTRFTPPSTVEPSRPPHGTSAPARERRIRLARTDAEPPQQDQVAVSVGSTQFTFSDKSPDTPIRQSAAHPLPQGQAKPARGSWRPTNGELVQFGVLAVIVIGILVGSVLAPVTLVLFVLVAGFSRWSQRSRRINSTPSGLAKYLRDVENAVKEIWRMAWGPGRGNDSTWKTVKVASFRAWLTIKGYGDQGRCSNGRHHCGQCANCRIGESWD